MFYERPVAALEASKASALSPFFPRFLLVC